jgi:hypothetical protein
MWGDVAQLDDDVGERHQDSQHFLAIDDGLG